MEEFIIVVCGWFNGEVAPDAEHGLSFDNTPSGVAAAPGAL